MKRGKIFKQARKLPIARKAQRPSGAHVKATKTVGRRHRPMPIRTPPSSRESRLHYDEAIRGIQDAAASLADTDVIEIISELSWPSRAKWLSSYFADQLPEEVGTDGDELAELVDDLGAQLAALLTAMDAEQPTDFLHAVTCCFSAEPSHVEAGTSWLAENTGSRAVDLTALEELPGYRRVAEILDQAAEASAG